MHERRVRESFQEEHQQHICACFAFYPRLKVIHSLPYYIIATLCNVHAWASYFLLIMQNPAWRSPLIRACTPRKVHNTYVPNTQVCRCNFFAGNIRISYYDGHLQVRHRCVAVVLQMPRTVRLHSVHYKGLSKIKRHFVQFAFSMYLQSFRSFASGTPVRERYGG